MSNNNEVEVQLISKTDRHGNEIEELKIGKKFVGEIKEVNDKLTAESWRNNSYHVKDVNEGVQLLLSEYNLHK